MNIKRLIAQWLFPEVLAANVAFLGRAEVMYTKMRGQIDHLAVKVDTLKLAQSLRLDWAAELSKTIDVVGTPAHLEAKKAKKKRT